MHKGKKKARAVRPQPSQPLLRSYPALCVKAVARLSRRGLVVVLIPPAVRVIANNAVAVPVAI